MNCESIDTLAVVCVAPDNMYYHTTVEAAAAAAGVEVMTFTGLTLWTA